MTTSPTAPQHNVASCRLSVIAPLGPGETEIGGLLALLAGLPAGSEVLLMLSTPDDHAPPDWPEAIPLRQILCPGSRAAQLNRGAAEACGAWLWFLHADTRFGPAALPALEAFLRRGEPALGWFDLAFAADGPRLTRLNAIGANLRSRWLSLPFGDQAFVLPADWFARLGRFDEGAAYGEDHLLAWAAHYARLKLRRVRATVQTSARKYHRHGWWQVTTRHLWLTAAQARDARRRYAHRRPGDPT